LGIFFIGFYCKLQKIEKYFGKKFLKKFPYKIFCQKKKKKKNLNIPERGSVGEREREREREREVRTRVLSAGSALFEERENNE
jgi:hypothetical protein